MDKLKSLQVKLSSALLWNSIEAVLYQCLLLGHQFALFLTVDRTFFGLQGAFIAATFLTITFLNGSLDTAITPAFTEITKNKKQFRSFLLNYLLSQTFILLIGAFLVGTFVLYFTPLTFFKIFANPFWIALFALFVASEGTKKNLRSILHLAFINKTTASIEVANIAAYAFLTWGLHFAGLPFTLPLLIIPFLFVSLVTNLFLLSEVRKHYATLPDENNHTEEKIRKIILKSRTFLYINEISRSLFSSNFLLPFFAISGGLGQAGIASLINSLTHSMTFFIQKVFGPSGAALFANTKNLSFESKQSAFSYLNQKCFYVICSLFVLFLLNGQKLLQLKIGAQSIYTWTLIYIFFLSHFLENLFIVYEKLFVAEEKSEYITFCNLASFAACLLTAYLLNGHSLVIILLCCMVMRLFSFLGLAYFAKKLWNLKLSFTLSPLQFSAPFLLSSFLFVLLWTLS